MSEQTVMSYEDETVDVYLSAALTDLRLHWRSLVDDTTGALRDTDQGSMVTRAAYAISEALKRGKRNAERIAELEAENMRLRDENNRRKVPLNGAPLVREGIMPGGTSATKGGLIFSDEIPRGPRKSADPRIPPVEPKYTEISDEDPKARIVHILIMCGFALCILALLVVMVALVVTGA
jgi:hypothetical protein